MENQIVYVSLDDLVLDADLDRYNTAKEPQASQPTSSAGDLAAPQTASQATVYRQSDDFLRESLELVGMREPLLVKNAGGNKWLLIDGYRRVRQIRYLAKHNHLGTLLDQTRLRCYVLTSGKTPVPVLRSESNERRQDLPPSLEGEKFALLNDKFGLPLRTIARMFGLSPLSVHNYIVINNVKVDEVKKAIDANRLPMSAGKVFSIMTTEGQQALWQQVARSPNVTRDELWALARKLEKRQPAMFKRPLRERMRISKHMRATKLGQVQERGSTRRFMKEDLKAVQGEIRYTEHELKVTKDNLARLLSWWESVIRNEPLASYVREHEPGRWQDVVEVMKVENPSVLAAK
jgi:ParB-like chromosome segregation protein Spo0J